MEMSGLMGGLYRICEWIMRFSVINVLWGLCSLPFVFVLFPILYAGTLEEMMFVLLLSGVAAPFFFFPATTAMFSVARKWVMGDVDVPLLKTFFRSYKDNYKQSLAGGWIYSILFVLFAVNFQFYGDMENSFSVLAWLFVALIILVFISMFNFFSIISHLHMSVLQTVKNAILITIGKPLTSIMIALANGVIVYFSFGQFQWLIPFFMGSLIAYISFFYFYRMFTKVQEKQQQLAEQAAEEEAQEG